MYLEHFALKELPFRFKYFQEIAGDVVLPAGFVPRRVIVEVEPRGGDDLEGDDRPLRGSSLLPKSLEGGRIKRLEV